MNFAMVVPLQKKFNQELKYLNNKRSIFFNSLGLLMVSYISQIYFTEI